MEGIASSIERMDDEEKDEGITRREREESSDHAQPSVGEVNRFEPV
jgi:hypothetical protein